MSTSRQADAHVRCFGERPGRGQVEGVDIPHNGPGYDGPRHGIVGPEPASQDDTFGSMAPCWRLLERAQAYMGKVCKLHCTVEPMLLLSIARHSLIVIRY